LKRGWIRVSSPPAPVFRWGVALLLCAACLTACTPPPPPPAPRYVLGSPYQARGVWHYPRESFELDVTGLASVMRAPKGPLTTDGELFDQDVLAAAHPTLQLPAIARVTNLENGLSVVVRINDRGSGDSRRLIEVTERTATLLRMSPTGATRVRLRVLPTESRDVVDTMPGAPRLALAAAPRGVVETAELPPPPGVRQGGGRVVPREPAAQEAPHRAAPALRLPETVSQEPPQPGRLMVRLATFEEYQYASMQRAKVIGLAPRIVRVAQGRGRQFRVEIGPLDTVARAESVLEQALAAGIPDARIVVD